MSIFTYYLASPFNLLSVFVGETDLPLFFFFSSVVKLSFGSAFFYLLCRLNTGQKSPLFLLFSVGYGLMSYNIIYLSNFMYIDVLMILPLIILGLLFLEKEKVHFLYPLSLAYALMTSWYLGAMVVIFIVIFFLARFFSMKGPLKQRLPYVVRFATYSLAGGLAVAAFWLTAFLHLGGTKAKSDPISYSGTNPLSIFFSGMLENNYPAQNVISRNTGYFTMFVGIGTLVFALLYFVNRAYLKRERFFEGIIFLAYMIGCLNSGFYTLLHGGKDPTWFPGRFTFVIGFLLCYYGMKEAAHYKSTMKEGLVLPLVALGIVLPIVLLQNNGMNLQTYQTYTISWVSFALYLTIYVILALLILGDKIPLFKKKYVEIGASVIIVALGCFSSYRGISKIVDANINNHSYQASSYYQEDCLLSKQVDIAKNAMDKGVYRMELTFNRPGGTNVINNNPLFYSYSGLNHYSSSEKKEVSNHMERLGFHTNPFYETYDGGSTQAINSYLGVRYLLDDFGPVNEQASFMRLDDESNPFQPLPVEGLSADYRLYENRNALPLGFATKGHSSTFTSQGEYREGKESAYWYDLFEFQNKIYSSITSEIKDSSGKEKPIFERLNYDNYSFSSGVTFTEDEHGIRRYNGAKGDYVYLYFSVPEEAYGRNLYFGVKDTNDKFDFTLDGEKYRVNDYFHKGIKGFVDVPSHNHTLKITFKENIVNEEIRPCLYSENNLVLQEYLTKIRENGALDLSEEKSFFSYGIKGTFNKNNNGEFLFTLPFEDNIHIYLDGVEKPLLKRFDVFSAISLEGVSNGTHQIEIRYIDEAFRAGFIVSIVGLGLLIPSLVFAPYLERKIKPFTRKEEGEDRLS